jgi:hypothetical protein
VSDRAYNEDMSSATATLNDEAQVAELKAITMRIRFAQPLDRVAFRVAYKDWSAARKAAERRAGQ